MTPHSLKDSVPKLLPYPNLRPHHYLLSLTHRLSFPTACDPVTYLLGTQETLQGRLAPNIDMLRISHSGVGWSPLSWHVSSASGGSFEDSHVTSYLGSSYTGVSCLL